MKTVKKPNLETHVRMWFKENHGLVDPLCGTSWDKWNWDKLHRGYGAFPGTRKGLQRGYMTCPMGQGKVSFDLSQSQLGQAVLVPLGQAQLVPICVPLGQVVLVPVACPTGTSQVQAPPFQSQPLTKMRVIPYQKLKGS